MIYNVFKNSMEHTSLGNIQPTHLPLVFMRAHFPATYDLLQYSTSLPIIRNPRDRFISAIQQRLREFRDLAGQAAINRDHRDAPAPD